MVLFETINKLSNLKSRQGVAGGGAKRLFVPPSTHYPLFRYGYEDDERSFLSIDERVNSLNAGDESDINSVSTSRSLPSTLDSNEDRRSFHTWLLEERGPRYMEDEDRDWQSVSNLEDQDSKLSISLSYDIYDDFVNLETNYSIEFYMLLKSAIPLVLTLLMEHITSVITLIAVGHLGKQEIAAATMGFMALTVTFGIFEGIATALDTLTPQAYGSGNHELVSIYVQSSIILSLLIYLPCCLIWWKALFILKYVIQNEEVIRMSSQYLKVLVFGGPPYIFFQCGKRFLQAQGIFEAGTGILFVSAPIHAVVSWALVWSRNWGLGFVGAPIALTLNYWLMASLLVLYVRFVDGSECWQGIAPFRNLLHEWGPLFSLGVPGVIMLESEFVAYELMTLLASYLGTIELAAQSAVLSSASLTYMIAFALSIAASTRIGSFLGGQNIHSAKIAARTSLIAALLAALLNAFFLFLFKRELAKLFTQDPEVTDLVTRLFGSVVAVVQLFDGTASVASGILRAQGRQKIGGMINLVSYYAIAFPLAVLFSFYYNFSVFGLWMALGFGMLLIGCSETVIIFLSDWDKIILDSEAILSSS